jgi:hypothetical protein
MSEQTNAIWETIAGPIVPHDASEDVDEIVLAVAHEVEISLYRDQVSAVLLTPALRPSE